MQSASCFRVAMSCVAKKDLTKISIFENTRVAYVSQLAPNLCLEGDSFLKVEMI